MNNYIGDFVPSVSVTEKIKQRSENLAISAEQRKALRDINISVTETSDFFNDNFSKMKENIERNVGEAKTIKKSELKIYLDKMVEEVAKIQNFLNESSMFLPSFTIKKSQESINILNGLVQGCISELQPKKKFGFKSMKDSELPKSAGANSVPDAIDRSSSIKVSLSKEFKEISSFGFKDLEGKVLSKPCEELKDRQLNLQNLNNCRVIALGNPSSLQFANLRDTVVIVGPTSRSAFVKDCFNCTLVLACQQVRIHNTQNTKFYLHVTGAAIIENCKNLSFGPYTLSYEELGEHYRQSGLNTDINNWRHIEDFDWLSRGEKSPNFLFIEEECWETNWL